MKLKPFFQYYGSKWSVIPKYPAPKHPSIFEPFAGSATYSLHYPELQVLLVDKYPVITDLWRYLINVSEDEIRSLPLVQPRQDITKLRITPEAKSLIGFWTMASSRPNKTANVRGSTRESGAWSASMRERVASQLYAIRHWEVQEGSYADYRTANDVTTFVDPPYIDKGYGYVHSSKSVDYAHLGNWCKRAQGQVIVCENAGAAWLPFTELCALNGQKKSIEAIWTQG